MAVHGGAECDVTQHAGFLSDLLIGGDRRRAIRKMLPSDVVVVGRRHGAEQGCLDWNDMAVLQAGLLEEEADPGHLVMLAFELADLADQPGVSGKQYACRRMDVHREACCDKPSNLQMARVEGLIKLSVGADQVQGFSLRRSGKCKCETGGQQRESSDSNRKVDRLQAGYSFSGCPRSKYVHGRMESPSRGLSVERRQEMCGMNCGGEKAGGEKVARSWLRDSVLCSKEIVELRVVRAYGDWLSA